MLRSTNYIILFIILSFNIGGIVHAFSPTDGYVLIGQCKATCTEKRSVEPYLCGWDIIEIFVSDNLNNAEEKAEGLMSFSCSQHGKDQIGKKSIKKMTITYQRKEGSTYYLFEFDPRWEISPFELKSGDNQRTEFTRGIYRPGREEGTNQATYRLVCNSDPAS